MPFSQLAVNFIFTFSIQHLSLLLMTAPSVTKSYCTFRKTLTAERIQQRTRECLNNLFIFYPVLQRLKDQLMFCCCDVPPKNSWESRHSPCTDTKSREILCWSHCVNEEVHWHLRGTLGKQIKPLHYIILSLLPSCPTVMDFSSLTCTAGMSAVDKY